MLREAEERLEETIAHLPRLSKAEMLQWIQEGDGDDHIPAS
jgi:hypothetical protein